MGRKDIAWRTYFSDEQRFADLINGVIGGGEQLICAGDLTDLDSQVGYRSPEDTQTASDNLRKKFRKKQWKKIRPRYRDLVRKVALGTSFVVIGIENQEKSHYLMPVRCMGYDVREYERQAAQEASRLKHAHENKEIQLTEEEYLSMFRREGRLMPCITLVLYFGDHWDGAVCLRQLLEESQIPEAFRPFINDYRVHILYVKGLKNTDVFRTDLKLLFDCVRYADDKTMFYKQVVENPMFAEVREDTYQLLLQYADLHELENYHRQQTNDHQSSTQKKGEKDMCRALQEMLEDSKQEGLSRGLSQGIRVLIKKEKAWHLSRQTILEDLVQEFGISMEEAEDHMREYEGGM